MSTASRSFTQLLALIAGAFVAFGLLQHSARIAETSLATDIAARLTTSGSVHSAGSLIVVSPAAHQQFSALVTPSCSSLASVLAILCLSAVTPHPRASRRLAALGLALSVVIVGNLLRISSSIAIGLMAGSSSLVLFHDWVGSIFGFAYTIGGYLLMLWMLLPARAMEGEFNAAA